MRYIYVAFILANRWFDYTQSGLEFHRAASADPSVAFFGFKNQ